MTRYHNDPQLLDDDGRCWCTSCIVARRKMMDVDDYTFHYRKDEEMCK